MSEVTITMRQIADSKPRNDDWWYAPVTFRQIVETSGLDDALWCMRCLPERELWRVKLLARSYALRVMHHWDAPLMVKEWVRTGDESFCAAARAVRAASNAWAVTAVWAASEGRAARAASDSRDARAARAAKDVRDAEDACTSRTAKEACALRAAYADELAWQTQELLRIMSLDYSPEALILKMPEGGAK